MREDNAYQTMLDTSVGPTDTIEKQNLEDEMNSSYRRALGELLFAMVTYRPDISFLIIKLSTFANNPAKEHYMAIKQIFRYLCHTMEEGITYWRTTASPNTQLSPSIPPKVFHQQNPEPSNTDTQSNMVGSVDSDCASDPKTRKSMIGIVMYLGGGAIHYKTKQQERVAWSSTEAEFVAACEAAKMAIHLRSILDEINISQDHATLIYEDNSGALEMANARQPTKRTKHMETKHFAIQDWVEEDLVVLEYIKSPNNSADTLTKPLARTAFYKHNDVIMGRVPPLYYKGTVRPTSVGTKDLNMLPVEHGGCCTRTYVEHRIT